jgi:hypothetical protein
MYTYYFFFLILISVAVILLNIQHAYEGYVIYQAAVLGKTQFPTPIALLAGPKAGMALAGHADANRHARLIPESFLCIQPAGSASKPKLSTSS